MFKDPLAYLTAKTHGLDDEANAILEIAGITTPPSILSNPQLLKAPSPLLRLDSNWPLLPINRGLFESSKEAHPSPVSIEQERDALPYEKAVSDWNQTLGPSEDFIESNGDGKDALNNGHVDLEIADLNLDDESSSWSFSFCSFEKFVYECMDCFSNSIIIFFRFHWILSYQESK